MRLKINDSEITWPGGKKIKPEGVFIPTHLKVLTIEEKPFVYVRKLSLENNEVCEQNEIPCPHFNSTGGHGKVFKKFSMFSVNINTTKLRENSRFSIFFSHLTFYVYFINPLSFFNL
jgi:hypothetical protein